MANTNRELAGNGYWVMAYVNQPENVARMLEANALTVSILTSMRILNIPSLKPVEYAIMRRRLLQSENRG